MNNVICNAVGNEQVCIYLLKISVYIYICKYTCINYLIDIQSLLFAGVSKCIHMHEFLLCVYLSSNIADLG